MGAAGRDFHNFNVYFRENPEYDVVGFTAAQIPGIARRIYPSSLSGLAYPNGIPICPEEDLANMIEDKHAEEVVLAYSDLSYTEVMHKASLALYCGADFTLINPEVTMLKSNLPVVSVCAVRTGAGKSTVTRKICSVAKDIGLKFSAVRHPMPYGELSRQVVQSFRAYEDLGKYNCTIEEREEYEPHIEAGNVVYAGIDYGKILVEAERDADMIVWDGGNNDLPFYKPTIHVVVADPHRPGDELLYYPSEINLKMANAVIINKVDTALPSDIETVEKNIRSLNSNAEIFRAASTISVENAGLIRGKRVLVIEDGPTVTHGKMRSSAGAIAATKFDAREIVDPHPYVVGSIKRTFEKYPHLSNVLPAMGYNESQINDLRETIKRIPCDTVIVGTPINLKRLIEFTQPSVRVRYEIDSPEFTSWIQSRLREFKA